MVWYDDPITIGMIIYDCETMDFGDGISYIVVKITQEKFLGTMCRLPDTKRILTHSAYADNYATSFQKAEIYQEVRKDMLEVHERIGLPLKATWTCANTEKT